MDKKKVLLIGGSVVAVYVVYKLYKSRQASAASQDAANAANDYQLLGQLSTLPLMDATSLPSGSQMNVDTGNSTLQSLINSILNPGAGASTSSSTDNTGTGGSGNADNGSGTTAQSGQLYVSTTQPQSGLQGVDTHGQLLHAILGQNIQPVDSSNTPVAVTLPVSHPVSGPVTFPFKGVGLL